MANVTKGKKKKTYYIMANTFCEYSLKYLLVM